MIYFKKNLSFLRSQKDMTLKELSENIGFTTSQWNNYELGLSYPKFLDLIKISRYFEVSETDLIHCDLQVSTILKEKQSEKNITYTLKIQNKLIKIQEQKIIDLEQKLEEVKSNRTQKMND